MEILSDIMDIYPKRKIFFKFFFQISFHVYQIKSSLIKFKGSDRLCMVVEQSM